MSKEILERERALAEEKQRHIQALLDERVSLQKQTEERLAAIAEELKALGYKDRKPRGPNRPKAQEPPPPPQEPRDSIGE